MPPKVKITKELIVTTALDLVRQEGPQSLNARNLALALHCSTQPIFSNFATMEELKEAVTQQGEILFNEFVSREMATGFYPEYKAYGMDYIRFAKEERELFKLLFMCDRSGESIPEDTSLSLKMEGLVQDNTGLDTIDAKLFHLEMWMYVHGIATLFATGFLDLDWELVSKMITDSYQGLRKQYGME